MERCRQVLGITRQNYYKHKRTPTTPTQLRRQWLTGLIREVHVASRGTYGHRRIHAELTLGMGITVCPRTVSVLMTHAGIYGLPGPIRIKRLRGVATADDLVNRKFHRLAPNELWVTDITQHCTHESWLYCCAVLDAFSRRIGSWSIDSRADSSLVVAVLDMAIRNRRPPAGGIVHTDHGTQSVHLTLRKCKLDQAPRRLDRILHIGFETLATIDSPIRSSDATFARRNAA